jgi:hypothetical protein
MGKNIMRITILFMIICLLGFLASCAFKRADVSDLNGDNFGVQDGSTQSGAPCIIVDIGDGLITKEDPLSDTFSVVLSSQPGSDVVLGTMLSSNPGEVSVAPSSISFTTSDWDIPKIVTVTGVDDAVVDGMKSVLIDLGISSCADSDWDALDPGDVTVHNLDNDATAFPGVTVIAGSNNLVSESGTPSSFSVVLNDQPTSNVTISVSVSDTSEGTITAPFSGASGSITFTTANWDIPQSITVAGVDDAMDDGNQPFIIVLGTTASADPAYNGTFNPSDVSYTNVDDDSAGITVIAGSSLLVSESGTTSSFEVVLNSEPTASVDINISVSDTSEGTIISPFSGSSGTITFTTADWSTPKTITVQGVDDFITDGNKAFNIVLGAASSGDGNYSGINPPDVLFSNVDDDSAGVTVRAGSIMLIAETGTSSSFEVVLNSEPTNDVAIDVTVGDSTEGTVTAPFGGTSGTITFTSGNWSSPKTITVAGVDDFAADGNISFNVVLGATSSSDPAYNGTFDPADVSYTNVDDDSAGVTVVAGSSMLVSEDGTTSSFSVVLNSQPTASVTIGVTVTDGSEGIITAPFAGTAGSITFTVAGWDIPQTITVAGVDDAEADGNQSFTVDLGVTTSTDPTYNGGFDPANVSFMNVDNDSAGVTVSAGSTMLVAEAGTTSSFEVVLHSQPSADVAIDVSVSDTSEGTITAPFAGNSGTITFTSTDWSIPQTISVTGVDDFENDFNQAFNVVLDPTSSSDPVYNGTFDPSDVLFVNVDDDSAGVTVLAGSTMVVAESGTWSSFEVVLNSEPTADVSIDLIVSDTSEGTFIAPFGGGSGTITFTSSDWDIPKTITVAGVDDFVADSNQGFNIVLGTTVSGDPLYNNTFDPADVAYINVDDDIPGVTVIAGSTMLVSETGISSSFEVVLNSQPTTDVSIDIVVDDPSEGTITAPFGGGSGTITFTTANWDIPKTITVAGVDDISMDGNQPFTVRLNTTLSSDPVYDGTFDPADVAFINVDNDTGGSGGVTVSAGSLMLVSEGGNKSVFEVVLNSAPTADVDIPVTLTDGSEGNITSPFAGTTGTITFTPGNWDIPISLHVAGVDDFEVDGNQTFSVVLDPTVSLDPAYNGTFDPQDVNFTNIDDDSAGVTVSAGTTMVVSEGGTTQFFDVVLNSQPISDVTIDVYTVDPSEGTIIAPFAADTGTLTFTTADWNVPQPVTVMGVDDGFIDGNLAFDIVLDPTVSFDPDYNGIIDPDDVTFINLDNESSVEVVIYTGGGGVFTSENGILGEFHVALSAMPSSDVTIGPITSLNLAEGNVDRTFLTFTPATWNVLQTVTVIPVDDAIPDGDQMYIVDLGTVTSADPLWDGLPPGTVTVINRDYYDIANYMWDNTGIATLASISGTGTPVTFVMVSPYLYPPEDEGIAAVSIPFPFEYMNMPYIEIMICTNGFAAFEYYNGPNVFSNPELFSNNNPNMVLAPWWDDLILGSGMVFYETQGVAPNRVFVVEWNNVETLLNSNIYTFQLRLNEGTNVIEFVYGPKIGGGNDSASMGINDIEGGANHFIDGTTGSTATGDANLRFADFPVEGSPGSLITFTP